LAQATADCNQAIASDEVVTTQAIKACSLVNAAIPTKCLHGPSVYEVSAGTVGDPTLLRVGYKPQVFIGGTTTVAGTFYVNDITRLCGDPIDPSLTPPTAPLTQAQVRALFTSPQPIPASTTTTMAASTATTTSCAGVFAQYGTIAGNSSDTIPPAVAALVANACSPPEFQAGITQRLPAAYTAMASGLSQHLEGLICPANPHTKLCP
jgi:hypothetical protein